MICTFELNQYNPGKSPYSFLFLITWWLFTSDVNIYTIVQKVGVKKN